MNAFALRSIWHKCDARYDNCTQLATHHVFFVHPHRLSGYVYRELAGHPERPIGRYCEYCALRIVPIFCKLNPEYSIEAVWIPGAKEALKELTALEKKVE